MTTTETTPGRRGDRAGRRVATSERPPLWRDVRVLRVLFQIGVLAGTGALIWWLFNNLVTGLNDAGISTDFDFLTQPTNFTIPGDPGFDDRNPVWQMVLVGIKNTFLAGFVGILLATLIGLIVGVSRLSSNWLVAKMAAFYVETLRNIPPLVVIVFFGLAVFTFGPLPVLTEATELRFPGSDTTWLIVSNSQWGIPSLSESGNVALFWILAAFALLVALAVAAWRTRINIATGRPHHRVLWFLGTLAVLVAVSWFVAEGPYAWSFPALSENRRRFESGFATRAGYLSITIALGLYTASHIAEIIRGSILAVPKGQSEAANSVALSNFQRYRFVVLPQALRIATPPTINQYLNLVKNTSLGTAVAYADITALTKTLIGNGKPAPQSIIVLMGVYIVFSLTISLLMNLYNRTLQLKEH